MDMDIHERYLPEQQLLALYLRWGLEDGVVLRRHFKRFWKNQQGLFLNPEVYSQGGIIVAAKNGKGRVCLSVKRDSENVLPLVLHCYDCGKKRVLTTFQKLMTSDHSRCRSCIARDTQSVEETRKKQKDTNTKLYGGPAPLCSSEVRERMQQTMIDRLGVPFAAQSELVKEKYRQTCIEQWGVKNYLASDINLSSITRTWSSKFSDLVFSLIRDKFVGELLKEKHFRIGRKSYFADIYIPSKQLIVECDGRYWHADKRFYSPASVIKYPGGLVMTASEVWERDKKRKQDLLSLEEIDDIVVVSEYDYIKGADFMAPIWERL